MRGQGYRCRVVDERVLKACQEKLAFVSVTSADDATEKWFERQVYPFIGASARLGQHKAQAGEGVDENKFLITCKGVDYAIWLVAKGTEEPAQEQLPPPTPHQSCWWSAPVARRQPSFAQFRYSLSGNEDSQSPGK